MGNRGITLLELIIAMTILAVFTGILVPFYFSYICHSQAMVCEENRKALFDELDLARIESDDGDAEEYLLMFTEILHSYIGSHDICPAKGNIRIRFVTSEHSINLRVICSKHKTSVSKEIMLD